MGSNDKYAYYVEQKALEVSERPRKFLQAFAAALEHSSYGVALDLYTAEHQVQPLRRGLPALRQHRGGQGHPLQPLRSAAQGLPAVFHPGR